MTDISDVFFGLAPFDRDPVMDSNSASDHHHPNESVLATMRANFRMADLSVRDPFDIREKTGYAST
jgi:hypothetical protein